LGNISSGWGGVVEGVVLLTMFTKTAPFVLAAEHLNDDGGVIPAGKYWPRSGASTT